MTDTHRPQTHSMMSPDEYLRAVERSHPAEGAGRPPRAKRVLKWVLVVAIAALVAGVGYFIWLLTTISNNPLDFSGLASDAGGRSNVLILGTGDKDHAGADLSDTIMLLSLEPSQKAVAQIGLPRDLRVKIPGYGYAKINQANSIGGPKLAAQTVSDTLNLPVHYYLDLNFSGFRGMVDAVGGVDIDVKDELRDPEYPCDNNQYKACGIDIKPGHYHMNGTLALQYVRCRKGTCGNDFGRAARQQEVMDQVIKKAANPWNILRPWVAIGLANAFRANVKTDMGINQLISLMWSYKHATTKIRFVFSNAPGGLLVGAAGSSDLLPAGGTYGPLQRLANDIFINPPQQPAN